MDLDISPALLVDCVVQTHQGQTAQEAQLFVQNEAMDMQATSSAALLNAVAGDLSLASGGAVGTRLNTLV